MSPQNRRGDNTITKSPFKSKITPKNHIWKEPFTFSNALSKPIIFSIHSVISSILRVHQRHVKKITALEPQNVNLSEKGDSNLYKPSIFEFSALPISMVSGVPGVMNRRLLLRPTIGRREHLPKLFCWSTARVRKTMTLTTCGHKAYWIFMKKTSANHSQFVFQGNMLILVGKKHWNLTILLFGMRSVECGPVLLQKLPCWGWTLLFQFSEIPILTSNLQAPKGNRGYRKSQLYKKVPPISVYIMLKFTVYLCTL